MTKRTSGKRGNGEGTIAKRSDGRWEAKYVAVDAAGRRRRACIYGRTRDEVARRLREAVAARDQGVVLPSTRETMGTFLMTWLDGVKPSLRYRTWKGYEQIVRLHLIPFVGRRTIGQLGPHHLQAMYRQLLDKGMSPTTVHHVHSVIHHALRDAVRWRLVASNVADLITPPRNAHHEMQPLSPDQARIFVHAIGGNPLEALYVLAVTSGLRQGELLALHWREVSLDRGVLSVVGTMQRGPSGLTITAPKTARSRRQVALTEAALASLRRHRAAQLETRLRAGTEWHERDLVFPNGLGNPVDAAELRRWFSKLLQKAGLPRISLDRSVRAGGAAR